MLASILYQGNVIAWSLLAVPCGVDDASARLSCRVGTPRDARLREGIRAFGLMVFPKQVLSRRPSRPLRDLPSCLPRLSVLLQDLDTMGKKDEDALDTMEGGSGRNGGSNANDARIV